MSKEPRARTAIFVTVAATIASAGISVAEAQQPDFTGVYEAYRAPQGQGQGRASGFGGARAGLPLTEEGRRRVEEYGALVGPERLNGGAHCVAQPALCGLAFGAPRHTLAVSGWRRRDPG